MLCCSVLVVGLFGVSWLFGQLLGSTWIDLSEFEACIEVRANHIEATVPITGFRLSEMDGTLLIDGHAAPGSELLMVELCTGARVSELKEELTAEGWNVSSRPGTELLPGRSYVAHIQHDDGKGGLETTEITVKLPAE
ncbi:hypothetical protein ABI59_07845 [Acidobacteria bacterium Mor1]|nr:hypothetical protein ABI59_07845 [Acidobacteria bacterium Mor1]